MHLSQFRRQGQAHSPGSEKDNLSHASPILSVIWLLVASLYSLPIARWASHLGLSVSPISLSLLGYLSLDLGGTHLIQSDLTLSLSARTLFPNEIPFSHCNKNDNNGKIEIATSYYILYAMHYSVICTC